MKTLASNLAFEKAEITRKKIEYLENYQAKSVVANVSAADMDVFSIVKDKDIAFYQLSHGAEMERSFKPRRIV